MEILTIEEAIAFCHEKSNNIKLKAEPQVFIQLGELLEELKKRRSEDYGYMADIHQSIGYRKAIDDFAEKLSIAFDETDIEEYGFYPKNLVRMVAGELKAGGENA